MIISEHSTTASTPVRSASQAFLVYLIRVIYCLAPLLALVSVADARPLLSQEHIDREKPHAILVPLKTTASGVPYVDMVFHDVGNMVLSVKNNGQFGPDMYQASGSNDSEGWMEFPKTTSHYYPTPRLLVGGIIERDTLVTQATDRATEWWPADLESQILNDERFTIYSINDTGENFTKAKSEQDISCVFYDTLTDVGFSGLDDIESRPHKPLNLQVRQTSYAWSFEFAEDFILIDYSIRNIGNKTIKDAYIGFKIRGGYNIDIFTGHLKTGPAVNLRPTVCEFTDSVGLYWLADSDGNPTPSAGFDRSSANSVVAVKLLRGPRGAEEVNWNWFSDDIPTNWGPRKSPTDGKPLRDYGGGANGEPLGDKNTYDLMSNGEIDYDQAFAALDHTDSGWISTPDFAAQIAAGPGFGGHNHHHSLLTVGPVDIPPGTSVPATIAYIGGERFHRNPDKFFNAQEPELYYEELFFDDLITNSAWANWVFDNPGIDSDPLDDDDYRGEIRVCDYDSTVVYDTTLLIDSLVVPPDTTVIVDTSYTATAADSFFYTGDGIPDFRAATPPPAPLVRFTPSEGEIIIEWNGLRSETTPDVFTQEIDFEGYRVYLGLIRRRADMTTQISYDIEDYSQRFFNAGTNSWIVLRKPFSLEEARNVYANGNTDWHPLVHDIDNPLYVGDSIFYFTKQDWNQDDLTLPDGIQRIYPDAPFPHTLEIDSAYADELTPDGKFFKRFEYRYVLRNLLPSQAYYVSVTAFDYGSQAASLPFLETNPVSNAVEIFAMDRTPANDQNDLDVIVYPNPYRADGAYRDIGFEGRGQEFRPKERTRAVNFANLPPTCTIRIFTMDGDLVDVVEHDEPPDSPTAMHEPWNIITRNIQPAVSGIYYWVVETPDGRQQIGKLVLIM